MASVVRVRRLVNPRTRKRKAKGKHKRNPHRRRLTPAQIAAGFGGKRRQSASKRRKRGKATGKLKHRRRRAANPSRPRVVYKTRTRTKVKVKYRTRVVKVKAKRKRGHRRRNNPAVLLTYGPALLNPRGRKRVKHVARKRKKRSNPRRVRTRVVTKVRYRTRSRKSNPRRRSTHRRRNPGLMSGGVRSMGSAVAGGLIGVTITKAVPSFLPPSVIASPIMRVVISAATAWGAGELASRFVGGEFGKYVFFGGLMQAGSVLLNSFLPNIGGAIGLSGVRGLVPSNDIGLPYNMFSGMGARVPAGGGAAGMGMGNGFAPAFAN